jgi:ubiquitin-protein ligase
MENDYLALQKLCVFHDREKIKILETQGQPPQFYRLQIFHPNVYHNGLINLGVSELREINHSLDCLVIIVIIMIQYKNVNFGCPTNLAAKDWANKNKNLFRLSGSESDGKQSNSPQIKWK